MKYQEDYMRTGTSPPLSTATVCRLPISMHWLQPLRCWPNQWSRIQLVQIIIGGLTAIQQKSNAMHLQLQLMGVMKDMFEMIQPRRRPHAYQHGQQRNQLNRVHCRGQSVHREIDIQITEFDETKKI